MDVFNVKENKYRVANRHSRTLPRNSRVDSDGKMAKRVSPIRRHFVKRDNAVECSICLQTFVQAPGGNTSNLANSSTTSGGTTGTYAGVGHGYECA